MRAAWSMGMEHDRRAAERRYGTELQSGADNGIRIGVNWSVLLIVALLAYGLAAGQFPADGPRRPEAEYVVAAIVTAAAYMASLLAHELAHSRRRGVTGCRWRGSRCGCWAGCPAAAGRAAVLGAEVRVAGLGRSTSLVLGGVFTLVAWLLHGSAWGGSWWRRWPGGWRHHLLAAFNVIPAAPLDGGRLLQAVLWAITKDRLKAAMGRAVRAGVRVGPLRGRRVSRAGPGATTAGCGSSFSAGS